MSVLGGFSAVTVPHSHLSKGLTHTADLVVGADLWCNIFPDQVDCDGKTVDLGAVYGNIPAVLIINVASK